MFLVFTVLTPPENAAGEFPDEKNSQHFPELSSRVVQLQKNHVHSVHVHAQPPIKKNAILAEFKVRL